MEIEETKVTVYPFNITGNSFLSNRDSLYSQTEYLEDYSIRIVTCDIKEKWINVITAQEPYESWDEMNLDSLKKNDTIDLNEKGDRWEGNSLNGLPFGFGCLYNAENQLSYLGFMFEGMKVCYGIEYYGDIGLIEYEGSYYKNMRYGYGKLYDKKNELIYEGKWSANQPIDYWINHKQKIKVIHYGIQQILIDSNFGDTLPSFRINGFPNLKYINIGDNSLGKIVQFEVVNCNELIRVKIGEESCCRYNHNVIPGSVFKISQCSKLNKLIIGDYSCDAVLSLELSRSFFLYFLL